MAYLVHSMDSQEEGELYTCFCAWPGTPRGSYDEEIDILVTDLPRHRVSVAEVKRTAQAELDANYDEGGKVKRVVWRPAGVMFF